MSKTEPAVIAKADRIERHRKKEKKNQIKLEGERINELHIHYDERLFCEILNSRQAS